jgi:hypothetical protein
VADVLPKHRALATLFTFCHSTHLTVIQNGAYHTTTRVFMQTPWRK